MTLNPDEKRHAREQAARADNVRSTVLFAVILVIVASPIIGMLMGIDPQAFSAYMAPVTGLAGTIVGYWFGQRT